MPTQTRNEQMQPGRLHGAVKRSEPGLILVAVQAEGGTGQQMGQQLRSRCRELKTGLHQTPRREIHPVRSGQGIPQRVQERSVIGSRQTRGGARGVGDERGVREQHRTRVGAVAIESMAGFQPPDAQRWLGGESAQEDCRLLGEREGLLIRDQQLAGRGGQQSRPLRRRRMGGQDELTVTAAKQGEAESQIEGMVPQMHGHMEPAAAQQRLQLPLEIQGAVGQLLTGDHA